MKNKGFIKLYRSVLSRPELTDLLTEEGGTGFGTYMMILLYLSQCDDLEGLYTNAQLSALASQARKSRAYINHIICDFGLFEIEGKRFRDSFMIEYSPARIKRFAGEEIEKEIEKENKEKPGGVCQKDTRPEPTTPQPPHDGSEEDSHAGSLPDGTRCVIGPSAYETIDLEGVRHDSHGNTVPWWAPPQTDVYCGWSVVSDRWVPLDELDRQTEHDRRKSMPSENFMMRSAYTQLNQSQQQYIQDEARRTHI